MQQVVRADGPQTPAGVEMTSDERRAATIDDDCSLQQDGDECDICGDRGSTVAIDTVDFGVRTAISSLVCEKCVRAMLAAFER